MKAEIPVSDSCAAIYILCRIYVCCDFFAFEVQNSTNIDTYYTGQL